jgi:hypothetical protein
VEEVAKTAKESAANTHEDCKAAISDFNLFGLTPAHAKEIYHASVRKVKALAHLRSGFYCSICDAGFHAQQSEFWEFSRDEFRNRLYFSADSCYKLVNSTIEASFYQVSYVKRYLEGMVAVMNCKTNGRERPQVHIDFSWRQKIKNCYFFRSKHFFHYCIDYCRELYLSQKTAMMDGDLENLYPFFRALKEGRSTAFTSSDNNPLADTLSEDEAYLDTEMLIAVDQKNFFEPQSVPSLNVGSFQTQFTLLDGANLWTPIVDHLFPIVIKPAFRVAGLVLFYFMLLSQ